MGGRDKIVGSRARRGAELEEEEVKREEPEAAILQSSRWADMLTTDFTVSLFV